MTVGGRKNTNNGGNRRGNANANANANNHGDNAAMRALLDRCREVGFDWITPQLIRDSGARLEDIDAALHGTVDDQLYMGGLFLFGIHGTMSPQLAAGFFRLAAERGDVRGQNFYAHCLQCGAGVQQNEVAAAALYRASAEQGDALGLFHYGKCLANGSGVERDTPASIRYFKRAADAGLLDAQVTYALCAMEGLDGHEGFSPQAMQVATTYIERAYGQSMLRATTMIISHIDRVYGEERRADIMSHINLALANRVAEAVLGRVNAEPDHRDR
jgi:hypothetical protein